MLIVVLALTTIEKLVLLLYSNVPEGKPVINGVVRAFDPTPFGSVVPSMNDKPILLNEISLAIMTPNTP